MFLFSFNFYQIAAAATTTTKRNERKCKQLKCELCYTECTTTSVVVVVVADFVVVGVIHFVHGSQLGSTTFQVERGIKYVVQFFYFLPEPTPLIPIIITCPPVASPLLRLWWRGCMPLLSVDCSSTPYVCVCSCVACTYSYDSIKMMCISTSTPSPTIPSIVDCRLLACCIGYQNTLVYVVVVVVLQTICWLGSRALPVIIYGRGSRLRLLS